MFQKTIFAAVLAHVGHNQVDGLQNVGIFEAEPSRAQGLDPHVCYADVAYTDVPWIMKRTYSDDASNEVATRDHPTYYELPKETGLTGDDFRYVVHTGNPQSISGTIANAMTTATGDSGKPQGEQFAAEPTLKYGILNLDGPSMQRASLKGKGAFYDFFTKHVDTMLEEFGARLAFDLFGDGNGIRGQISDINGNVLTLAGARTADKFKRGMVIGAATGATGLTGVQAGTTFVTKINRGDNTIEVNDAADITTLAVGQYLFAFGEPGTCIEGMGQCTPLTAPTAGNLFRTVERTNDLEALAGSRIDNSSVFPEDALGDLAVEVHCLNHRLTRGVMHPVKFQEAVKRLGAKVEYTNPGGNADIGFESITLHVAGAAMKIMSDPDCPFTVTRGWNPRSHKLVYLGSKPVHWIRTAGGGQYQWSTSSDGIQMRARFHGNYLQPDPSEHGVASVAA